MASNEERSRARRDPPGGRTAKPTKIDNMPLAKKPGSSILKKPSPSSGGKGGGGGEGPTPAFNGAKFDKSGYCIKHPKVQLADPMKDGRGKLIYQELRVTCPSCQTDKYRSKKTTSLGGGKVKTGHRVHGTPSGGSSRSRSKSRDEPRSSSSRSKSRDGRSSSSGAPRQYDTPFDSKGRCHHHKNVQLAAKKQFGGGWKVLHSVCPKCMEDKFGDDDDRSVKSGYTQRSTRSSGSSGGGSRGGGNAGGQFDKNGCCALHTHIQVAKKRVFGSGWKIVRACPACNGNDVDADDYSVRSGRSNSSRRSTRSAVSTASRGKPGKAQKSGRYGALPFDGDGYCCRHPNVQLARKKALGGFKIIHDVCPECSGDDGNMSGGRKKPQRRKSGTGRLFDDSGSETSSYRSGKSGKSGSRSGSRRKKRIRVRNLKTEDEEGKIGRYSGYVNEEHQPHGEGVMKYSDGTLYEGVWSEGSKVHGKTKSRRA